MTELLPLPTYNGLIGRYGKPANDLCTRGTVTVKYPLLIAWDASSIIHTFKCHVAVASALNRIFDRVHSNIDPKQINSLGLNIFGGCFNHRLMKGSTSKLSAHSWGIAVDMDPSRNQLRWGKNKARLAKPDAKVFWDIVESEGALSSGLIRNFDWMHFQFCEF